MELLFYSFTNLSATGLGDVLPVSPQARILVVANRVHPGAPEISRKDFEQSIERKVDVIVPFDLRIAAQAAKLGKFPAVESLKPVESCGTLITLEDGVLFDFGKSDIRADAAQTLGKLATVLTNAKVPAAHVRRLYGKGLMSEVVQQQGGMPALQIVHSGQVKQCLLAEDGTQRLLRILGPGEFMGEHSVLTGRPARGRPRP